MGNQPWEQKEQALDRIEELLDPLLRPPGDDISSSHDLVLGALPEVILGALYDAGLLCSDQEWTWRHNRYVGVEQAVRDGVIADRAAAERSAAVCRRANPGHDVGVVTRFVTPWVEVDQAGGVTNE